MFLIVFFGFFCSTDVCWVLKTIVISNGTSIVDRHNNFSSASNRRRRETDPDQL